MFSLLGFHFGQLLDGIAAASCAVALAPWACVKAAGDYASCVKREAVSVVTTKARRDFDRWVKEWQEYR